MPARKQLDKQTSKDIADVLRSITSTISKPVRKPKTLRKPNKDKRKNPLAFRSFANISNDPANNPMPSSTGLGLFPRSIQGMSDLVDFTISYNGADIVLGGGVTSTAPGILGNAFWYPRGPSASGGQVLTNSLLPVAPGDTFIGRTNVADILKHYCRKIVTSVRVFLTPELTNTSLNGLFAIAAVRGGSDTVNAGGSSSGSAGSFSDTDVMSMKNSVPFRIYDSLVYDASWAIAGGTGPQQNEFGILNSDTTQSTVIGNTVDGLGLIPTCLYMGGSALGSASTSASVVTHRCVIEMRMHLLDYRGTLSLNAPMLSTSSSSCSSLRNCGPLITVNVPMLSKTECVDDDYEVPSPPKISRSHK